jgi:16S rRNA (uracil1498-N3)-methyltransferase
MPDLSLQDACEGQLLEIGKEWSHHTTQVLRYGPGDSLELCASQGQRWRVEIRDVLKKAMTVVLCEQLPELPPPFPLFLAQGLTKGDKFDLILRMGTELGVTAFLPFLSSRCVSRPDAGRLRKRQQRWEKIVRESSRQSQRTHVPELKEVLPLANLVSLLPEEMDKLVLWEGEQEQSLQRWVREHPTSKGVAVVVGPEGGFSEEEVRALEAQGFASISLGQRILRTETAGPAAAAILQFAYETGD